jgi:hypothetical protein
MDNIWSWIKFLPLPAEWPSAAAPSLLLASSKDQFILFQAECASSGSSPDTPISFSISLHEYHSMPPSRTLWASNPSYIASPSNLHFCYCINLFMKSSLSLPFHLFIKFECLPSARVIINGGRYFRRK